MKKIAKMAVALSTAAICCVGVTQTSVAATAAAAPYPAPGKSVRLVVPFAPGSGTDLMTRILAEDMQAGLGVPIVVENKPGANGYVAAEYISKQPPDGYTLLLGTSSAYSANPWLMKEMAYDPIKDVTPIALTTDFPFYLAVNAESKVRNLDDFLQYTKSAEKITMGYGNATGQVANAHLMRAAGFEAISVPYKSTPPALVDMVGGRFDFMFVDLASSQTFVKAEKVRPIAMMADKRSSLMPALPALGEKLPGFNYLAWGGLMGPPGMPAEIVSRLNAEVVKTLGKPEIKNRFAMAGLEPFPSTSDEFAKFMVEQLAAWGEKIKEAGITPQ